MRTRSLPRPADPAWVGSGTGVDLLYCAGCARLINRYTPGTCRLEVPVKPDLTIANDAQTPKRLRPSGALLASLLAIGAGADPFPGMPEPRPAEPNPDRGRHAMSLGYAPIVIHGAVQVGVYGDDADPPERARGIEAACAIAKAVGRAEGELWLLRLPGGGVSSGCDREARAFETARFGALRWFEMESDLTIREI